MINREFVIEKVVLAFVLLLVGASLTYIFNFLDSKNDFRHEVNKIRISKVGDVWEKFSEFENSFNELYEEVERVRMWPSKTP